MAVPFTGIDAPGTVSRRNNWPMTPCNVVELKPQLMKYLEHITGTHVKPRDIMDIDVKDLEPADVLIASPPCQPYTKMGHQKGAQDSRAEPFIKLIYCAAEQRKLGDLKAVIIEESPGVLEYKLGMRFIDIIDNWPITFCNAVELNPQLLKCLEHIAGTQVNPRNIGW